MAPHFTPCTKFGMVPGVIRVKVGFCGGTTPNPCYEDMYVNFKAYSLKKLIANLNAN